MYSVVCCFPDHTNKYLYKSAVKTSITTVCAKQNYDALKVISVTNYYSPFIQKVYFYIDLT